MFLNSSSCLQKSIVRFLSSVNNLNLFGAACHDKVSGLLTPLFAVVHILGKQFKITNYDIIRVQGHMPVDMGETITLEKVLMVGSPTFTFIGAPFIPRELCNIQATLIEKGMTHMYTDFKYWKKPHPKSRMRLLRYHRSVLRINSINLNPISQLLLDESQTIAQDQNIKTEIKISP